MGEQLNERVGRSRYPRGDQPKYRACAPSTGRHGEHHLPNQRCLAMVKGITKACTGIEQCARPFSFSHSPQSQRVDTSKRADRTSHRSRTEHSHPIRNASHACLRETLSVHLRAQNTMLPNNSVFDLWNEYVIKSHNYSNSVQYGSIPSGLPGYIGGICARDVPSEATRLCE